MGELLTPAIVQTALSSRTKDLSMLLPAHLQRVGGSVARIIRSTILAMQDNPELAECDLGTLVQSVRSCAHLGFDPGGPLGHAFLTPRWNGKKKRKECRVLVGYKGYIELAKRAADIDIETELVWVNERKQFRILGGTDRRIEHEIDPERPVLDESNILGAYAVARFADGRKKAEYLPLSEILKIKRGAVDDKTRKMDEGKAAWFIAQSPWSSNFGEMARKTAVRRLQKYLPLSLQSEESYRLGDAMALDESLDSDEQVQVIDVEFEADPEPKAPPKTSKQRVKEAAAKGRPDMAPDVDFHERNAKALEVQVNLKDAETLPSGLNPNTADEAEEEDTPKARLEAIGSIRELCKVKDWNGAKSSALVLGARPASIGDMSVSDIMGGKAPLSALLAIRAALAAK